MEPKGISIPGLIQTPNSQVKDDKRSEPPVRPVLGSKGTEMEVLSESSNSIGGTDRGTASITEKEAERAVQILKEDLKNVPSIEVDWNFNRDAGILVVQVKDKATGKVLREIPPEQVLKILGGASTQGIIIDKKA